MVLGLCERFGCLPSQLFAEDSSLLRMVRLESLAQPTKTRDGGE
ncbi:MAG: hypothetical protein AB7W59_02230 [Acidimicrobiia bacterium]